jgi:tRNA(Arg) A34 adenosine deaminase TadA
VALSDDDTRRLGRCVELASQALDAGDEPFGSVLLSADGRALFEDHNHVAGGPAPQYRDAMMALYAARFRP